MWADAGEAAAQQCRADVEAKAHASETHDREAMASLHAGLAGLEDGRADPEDIAHLKRAARLVARSADLDRAIGEALRA